MKHRVLILMGSLIAILVVSQVLLIRQNLQMRAALKRDLPRLQAGDKVPEFTGRTLEGKQMHLAYDGTGPKKVYCYFTSPCPYCRKQFPRWLEVMKRTDHQSFQIIGLVNEAEDQTKLQNYLAEMGCKVESSTCLPIVFIPEEARRQYKLSATPTTLIVGNNGTIERNWVGAWNDSEFATACSVFGMNIAAR